jgi:signal transduction histidine kinase
MNESLPPQHEPPAAPDAGGGAVSADPSLMSELERLRRENAVLRETIDTLDGTVVVYDAESRYVLGNRRYHEFFPHLPPDPALVGRSYEEVLGLSLAARVTSFPDALNDPAAHVARRSAQFRARRLIPRESYDARRDRWYLIRSTVTPTGNVISLRVDITEQKRLQGELLAAREAAEQAGAVRARFLGGISHELRTPLNAIINFAHLLGEQLDPSQGREFAHEILESGWHLQRLLAELLDLGRAEAGRLALREDVVDVERVVGSAFRLVAAEALESGVGLQTEIPAGLPMVRADEARLRQSLVLLLTSAIRHSAAGTVVRIEGAQDAAGVRLCVIDTGAPFIDSELAQAFEPFDRGMPPPSGRAGGLGLGLALTRHVLTVQGGAVAVESREGETRVSLSLPLAMAMSD